MLKKSFTRIIATTLMFVLLLQTTPFETLAKKKEKYSGSEYTVSGKNVIIDPDDYEGDTAQKRAERAGSAMFHALYHMGGSGAAKGCSTIILKDDIYITQSTNESVNFVQKRDVTIRGEKSGGGQVKITQGLSENYLFRFERGSLTLDNIILEGAENIGVAKFIDWDNPDNPDEWYKYSGGAFYSEDASLYLKNTTIQNFTRRGSVGSSFLGGMGCQSWGGAAVMMFDNPKEGASNITYHYEFSMDSTSKIINCNDANYQYYSEDPGGSSVYIKGKNFEEAMKVTIAGEISGTTETAVSCRFADVFITSTAHIHDCKGSLGGAFRLLTCSLDMSGGLIENCTADSGGAFYIDAGETNIYTGAYGHLGTLKFNGGTIQNCSATNGGAIYCERYEIKNNNASDNKKDYYIYYPFDRENQLWINGFEAVYVVLNGVNLLNNTATNNGGAVMNNQGFVEFRSGTIANNKAKDGGGVYKAAKGNFILSGGDIKDNTASDNGADVFIDSIDYYSDHNYFMVKGAPKTSTPIYVSNLASGYYNGFFPVLVVGEVTGLIRFDFRRISSKLSSDYKDTVVTGYGSDVEKNNAVRKLNSYKMTANDFSNLSIAPTDYISVQDPGGGSYRYGDVFPMFIDSEDDNMVIGYHKMNNLAIHLSENGNDQTGDGSREKPIKTYAKARELMLEKHTYRKNAETGEISYYYINSLAVDGAVTPEMGIPDELLPMLWYPINTSGCIVDYAGGNYAREDKKVFLASNDSEADANEIDWIVLNGEIESKIEKNKFVFDMPASSVSVIADNGQVLYVKDIQLDLDVPNPDKVEETSFVTIKSVKVENRNGENEKQLTEQEIIDVFGSKTAKITWKKVEAGNYGFTNDEPFAVFSLDTSFIKNAGNGYAMPKDVKISVNANESAVRVDSYEKCTVAHLVNRDKIPDLKTPEVLLVGEKTVKVENTGATNTVKVSTSGIYEFTKPIKWKITEIEDNNDILEISGAEGLLPTGTNPEAALGNIIIASNKIGEGEKTAKIKISFSKEDGILNYDSMPNDIVVTYVLSKGDPLPEVKANIDYTKETLEITPQAGLEDYVIEYLVLEEGTYNIVKWDTASIKIANNTTLSLEEYISNYGLTPLEIHIRYRQLADDPGPGKTTHILIPTRPKTPEMTIDYAAETTNQVATPPMIYGTAKDSLTTTSNYEVVALTPGTDMYFQYAPTDQSFASKIQHLTVKARDAAPKGIAINYHDETTDKLIGDDIQYGYSEEELLSATKIGDGIAVKLFPGTNTLFAFKATADSFRSEIATLNVPNRPETPSFTVDYTEEKTEQIIPNSVWYGTNEATMDIIGADRRLDLTPGTDVYFFKPSTATAFKSEAQHLVVKKRRDAPDVKGSNEDIWCEGDGKITGLSAASEYRMLQSNGEWGEWKNNGSNKNIKNLTTGTYEVRYTPTSSEFKSHTATVKISYDRTITVKFDTNKGSKITSQTGLKYGATVTKPADPEKRNCEFVGWYDGVLLLDAWDFGKDTVKDDLTLHAKWKRNKMDDPENVRWDKFTAKWDAVDDEDEYIVKLYKEGNLVETITTSKTSYDMSSITKKNGSGNYSFTVVAVSKGIKDSEVVISVSKTYYRAPDITKDPENFETTETADATFSAGATVDRDETLSYQWQRKKKGSDKWNNISGATSKDYTIDKTVLEDGNYTYRCAVEDKKDNVVYTKEATLIVNKKPEVSISASKTLIETGDKVTLTATAKYGTGKLTYKWTDENGSTTNEITLKLKETSKLKVTVTDEKGVSNFATITVTVKKTQAELVYGQFTSLDEQIKNASGDTSKIDDLYYLMKSAVDGYEALTALEKEVFNEQNSDNNMSAKYQEYNELIKKADEFTAKVVEATSDYKPATKLEVEALEKECDELIASGVPVSTSISDEKTGTIAQLRSEVEATRTVEKDTTAIVREVLSQMSEDELTEFKSQMKQYMGEIPEPEKLPGFLTYLGQLFRGEAELDFFTYISRAFESKTSAELREFKEAFVEFVQNHENKEEMIKYAGDTLSKAYDEKNDEAVQNTTWDYNTLSANEKDMVAPALKSLLRTLYDEMISSKNEDDKAAIIFEEKLEDVEANPTIATIQDLIESYEKLSDAQKELLSEDVASRVEQLRSDYNAAINVSNELVQSSSQAKLISLLYDKEGLAAQQIINNYKNLSDTQRMLVKDALGKKADNVIEIIEIIKLIYSINKNSSEAAKTQVFEEISRRTNCLSSRAKNLFEQTISAASSDSVVYEYTEWRKNHQFICTANTEQTEIEVRGITVNTIKDVVEKLDLSEIVLQANDVPARKASESDVTKKNVLSIDTRLIRTISGDKGDYKIQDVTLSKAVQVKIKLPNNYDLESFELWNITKDNVANNIKDLTFVWEENELYVVFETTTFGQFVVYAKDITTTADILLGDTVITENIGDIEIDTYFNTSQTVSIKVNDKGLSVTKLQYFITSSIYDYQGIVKISGWKDYTAPVALNNNRSNVVYVKVTDKLGNVTYAASTGVLIDTVAPTISGVKNGAKYCSKPTMTVTDNNLKTVTVDGKSVSAKYTLQAGTHTVTATDLCGNETTISATVYDGHKAGEWQTDKKRHWRNCVSCGEQLDYAKHKYNQKVVADKYLKKAATYNKEGTYYKSCKCGKAAKNDTFKGGGLKYDGVAPTVTIEETTNGWNSFWNKLTGGWLGKKTAKFKIKASDGESGVDKKYHYDAGAPMDVNGVNAISWWDKMSGNSFSVNPKKTKEVYVKVVDKQGNYTIIDSSGKVVVQYIHPQ